MANFGDLLGSFVQNAMSQSGEGRLGNMIQDVQANLSNQVESRGGVGGILGNVLDMAKDTIGNAAENPAQAAGIGAVIGSLLGGGSSSVSGAVKGGALAVLAGVAYKALTNAGTNAGQAAPSDISGDTAAQVPVEIRGPQTPAETQVLDQKAELVIKGMMNVAKADGEVSADEIQRIVGRLKEAGMDADAEAWIMAQLRHPLDLDAFVAEIPDAQTAAEVYAASLLAVEVDTDQERAYLTDFARKTGIGGPVAHQIEQTLGVQV